MNRTPLTLLALVFMTMFLSGVAQAKLFRNAYVSYELPPKWKCSLEATEWICTSDFYEKTREAMIVLTAKEVGPSDTLQTYLSYLNVSKTIPSVLGKPITSQLVGVKNRVINNHMWVDGMHMGSEVPSYYTRYLGTVKENIAILVTFTAHKTHYTKYSQDFLKAIQSLQVVATKSMLTDKPLTAVRSSRETLGTPIGQVLPSDFGAEVPPEGSGSGKVGSSLLGILILLAAAAYYFLFMGKKKRRK